MENNDDDAGIAGPLLSAADATRFGAVTAYYLAQDRVEIQFAVKEIAEIARRRAAPRLGDMWFLKRLARYLVGAP